LQPKQKLDKIVDLINRIKELDRSIKIFFNNAKTRRVRKSIIAGSTKSLCKAVRNAMNVNITNLPKSMFYKKEPVPN
jgi:hypothetical protein